MRVMTIAVLGLGLTCGASAALSQQPQETRQRDIKGMAAPATVAGTLSSTIKHRLKTDARQLKTESAASASLKGAGGDASSQPASEATRLSLSNRLSSVELGAGSVKPQVRQSFAAASRSSQSSFGLRSSIGTGDSGSPESIKQPEFVHKLR